MKAEEFKKRHLVNAFYWVDKSNCIHIQEVFQKFGIRCHAGSGFIEWHDGFKNLATFPPDEFHDFEFYQKVGFWSDSFGEAKDYDKMIYDSLLVSAKNGDWVYYKGETWNVYNVMHSEVILCPESVDGVSMGSLLSIKP